MISHKSTARYLNLLRWFVRDSIGRYPGWVLLIAVMSFAGVFFQVSAISQILYYAKLINSGKELALMGHTFEPRTSVKLLALAAGGIFLAISLSAGVTYLAQRTALRLSMRYERLCLRRCFEALGSVPPDGVMPFMLVRDPHQRVVKSDPRLAGRAFLKAIQSIVPTGVFLVAVATLFYLNWRMTLLLIPLGAAGAYAIAKGNIRSAKGYNDYESSVVPALRERGQLLSALSGSETQREAVLRQVDESLANGPTNDQTTSYALFMQAADWNNCLNAVILGFGFLLVLLFLGYEIIVEQAGWGRLIVYLVGLRYAMDHLKQGTSNLLAVNRFMPQIERLSMLLRHESVPPIEPAKPQEIRFILDQAEGDAVGQEITPNAPTAVISPFELDLMTVEWFHATLLDLPADQKEALRRSSVFFSKAMVPLPRSTIREAFGLRREFTLDSLSALQKEIGLKAPIRERLADVYAFGLDAPLDPKQWKNFDRLAYSLLGLAGAQAQGKRVAHVDAKILTYLPRCGANTVQALLRDTQLFIHYGPSSPQLFLLDEPTALVLGVDAVLAFGSKEWCEENMPWIERQRNKAKEALKGLGPASLQAGPDSMEDALVDL